MANTFKQLAQVGEGPLYMSAARDPITGKTILFSNEGTSKIDVWEQATTEGALTLIGTAPVTSSWHYVAEPDNAKVVLNFLGVEPVDLASYTITVTASGNSFVLGPVRKQINTHGIGSEVDWLPAANRWAIFYKSSGVFYRCWINP